MNVTALCYRHSSATWIASCEDCTASHLANLRVRRGASPAVRTTALHLRAGVQPEPGGLIA